MQRKYQVINEQLILFDEEYYLSVLRIAIDQLDDNQRAQLFDTLYAFSSEQIELEIDVSEEDKNVWYLQMLVPYMLTLSQAAIRRMTAGHEELEQYLQRCGIALEQQQLIGDEIYTYVERYNPDLQILS